MNASVVLRCRRTPGTPRRANRKANVAQFAPGPGTLRSSFSTVTSRSEPVGRPRLPRRGSRSRQGRLAGIRLPGWRRPTTGSRSATPSWENPASASVGDRRRVALRRDGVERRRACPSRRVSAVGQRPPRASGASRVAVSAASAGAAATPRGGQAEQAGEDRGAAAPAACGDAVRTMVAQRYAAPTARSPSGQRAGGGCAEVPPSSPSPATGRRVRSSAAAAPAIRRPVKGSPASGENPTLMATFRGELLRPPAGGAADGCAPVRSSPRGHAARAPDHRPRAHRRSSCWAAGCGSPRPPIRGASSPPTSARTRGSR